MSGENYVNTASVATTAALVGPADLTFTVAAYTGFPDAPYWGMFEKGGASAELVRVTNVAGSVLTITRGQGGTAATSHGAGVTFEHVVPASHFNEGETHNAATTAHGVTGAVVGTTGNQTLQDKTFRGAHRSLHSDALPAGVTASYESVADNASARDGFVHKNTAGDAARAAFLAQQSGVDRFRVSNTGNVAITPSTGTALTVNGNESVTGNTTVGGTLGVTGAATLSGGASVTGGVTASGTVSGGSLTTSGSVTGLSASILGPIHAGGALDTDSTLVVDGASTLTGAVSAGASIAAAQGITSWGAPVAITVSSTAVVTSPATDQLVYDLSDSLFKRWTGSTWETQFAGRTTVNRHEGAWTMTGQSIPTNTPRSISWSTITVNPGDITLSDGGMGTVTNGVITFNRSGLWDLSVTVKNPVSPSGSNVQAFRMRQPDDTGTLILGDSSNNCSHDCGIVRITSGVQYSVIYVQQTGSSQTCSASFRAVWLRA